MAGSTFGNIFKITTWGESHGKALGVVIDGCPAGLEINEEIIQSYLNRRKPGQSKFSTPRKESDLVTILSGVFEGKTTGTPISLMVENTNQHSGDYSNIAKVYRPGHADYTYDSKYGFRDYRGGGRSSGRETIGRVAAGAVAIELLKKMGIQFITYTKSIGEFETTNIYNDPTILEVINSNALYMPNVELAEKTSKYLDKIIQQQDSVGGVIECVIKNTPLGLGDPCFEKLNANLAKAICSIGAVKAFEIGDGIAVGKTLGSINNDQFIKDGKTKTNHAGGILGGISSGNDIILRAHIKPTPSIAQSQNTINSDNEEISITIKGRHDPIIVPRAVVVVESMAALTLVDALLLNMSSKLDKIIDFYNN